MTIVNTGSIEGLGANPRHAAYCATKAGLHGLTRAVAVDHGHERIRCNAVAPRSWPAPIRPATSSRPVSTLDELITLRLFDRSITEELSIPMPPSHDVLFRTLADPTRRTLFERLCREGEQTVGALTAGAGVSQPAVSKHLAALKQAGLVHDRHEGRQTHYRAQLDALVPLVDWTRQMAGFWESRFDDLEDLLKRMDQ